ncbi:MAG: DUF3024 domain-containing protein [Bacteroidetes bacterium]|nr:DUF3024 domain-containing protein [Bacteroidota bacterium]
MGFTPTEMLEIIETMEAYMVQIRPPEHIRPKLDIGYRIEKLSVIIFEICPNFENPEIFIQFDFAKTTFIRRHKTWKVYWMRSSLNWDNYPTKNPIKNLSDFVRLIEDDEHGCFKG